MNAYFCAYSCILRVYILHIYKACMRPGVVRFGRVSKPDGRGTSHIADL